LSSRIFWSIAPIIPFPLGLSEKLIQKLAMRRSSATFEEYELWPRKDPNGFVTEIPFGSEKLSPPIIKLFPCEKELVPNEDVE
jgi:hypothetical protein